MWGAVMGIYGKLLDFYLKCERVPVVAGINLMLYRAAACLLNPDSRRCRGKETDGVKPPVLCAKRLSDVRMAMIADTMTFDCFSSVCRCKALTAKNWRAEFAAFAPQVFFCESAWSGCEESRGCWRGQIYKTKLGIFENRRTVLEILEYCSKTGIPTIFYNKEDPTSFDDPYHNFVDLALRFDYIYTTSEECVPKYYALGAKFCKVMQMGFSLSYYNPLHDGKERTGAVFAGSYYAEHKLRCRQMEELFDDILAKGIPLTIYDRNSEEQNSSKRFPAKYQPYVKPAVPFKALGQELKKYRYAVNINTVVDSKTMFARRIFEVMALGLYVISNPSEGLKETFGSRISFTGEELPQEARYRSAVRENLRYVMENHSYENRMQMLCRDIGLTVEREKPKIICLPEHCADFTALPEADYYYFGEALQEDLQRAATHFAYLKGKGVCYGAYLTHERLEPFVPVKRDISASGALAGLLLEADTVRLLRGKVFGEREFLVVNVDCVE